MPQNVPFNKVSNELRRLDEAETPSYSRRPSDELVKGGLSADNARRKRFAKSERKAAARPRRRSRKIS